MEFAEEAQHVSDESERLLAGGPVEEDDGQSDEALSLETQAAYGAVFRRLARTASPETSRYWAELAGEAPRGAVLAAWASLADEAQETARVAASVLDDERLSEPSVSRSPVRIAEELNARALFPDDALAALRRLHVLRNRAAHLVDVDLTVEGALSFVDATRDLTSVLRRARLEVFAGR